MSPADSPRRVFPRWLRNIVIILAACYLALLFYVQVSEHILRHRAERLLTTMRQLQAGTSTWADLQTIRTRWGAWGNYGGSCTSEHCEYMVELYGYPNSYRLETLMFYLGHGHMASVYLRTTVDHGLVTLAQYGLTVQVPKGYGTRWEREEPQSPNYVPYSSGEYSLIAKAANAGKIHHLCCYWPLPVPHPNYVLTKPSGCMNCLAIWTEFLPQATPSEKQRLTDFNFNCITRWTPCADEEDIMPQTGPEFYQQQRESERAYARLDQCSYTVPELSVAARNAAVVQVESIRPSTPSSYASPSVQLIKHLAGSDVWNKDQTVVIDGPLSDAEGQFLAKSLRDRKPLIILYASAPREDLLQTYPCGLLPFSEQMERDVTTEVSLGRGIPQYADEK